MPLPKRIVAIIYCLLLVYCSVWIPWCEAYRGSSSYHSYRRIGYGWVFAGPRVLVEEPDGSTFVPTSSQQKDQASGFTVAGEESMRRVVQSGLVYAEPDVRLIFLRLIAVSALAAAAFLGVGMARSKI
jgi:hypothetical protein